MNAQDLKVLKELKVQLTDERIELYKTLVRNHNKLRQLDAQLDTIEDQLNAHYLTNKRP